MANEAVYYGTGRRKNAVARVRLVPGTGKVTVNGREAMNYFGREALVNYATMPFKVTDTQDHFDVIALCDGGGISACSMTRSGCFSMASVKLSNFMPPSQPL